MPRPRKCRKVCCLPKRKEFVPVGGSNEPPVVLTVDEYETIRLIDKQGFSQEQCAVYMQVARTTAQQIYNNAREKLAKVLVEGLPLKIEGGDYRLCSGGEEFCGCGGCRRHIEAMIKEEKYRKEHSMKIIIPVDDEKNVCVTFARAPQFAIKDIATGEITYIDNPACQEESGAGLKASQVVVDSGANILLTMRLGENSAEILKVAQIEIYKTSGNNVEENFNLYEQGKLEKLTHFHQGYQGIQ